MLLTVFFWGINFSIVKIALREFTPHAFNGLRLVSASLLLLFVMFMKRGHLALPKQDLWKVIVISFIGNSVYQVLFIQGINLTTASNTSLIMAATPVIIALLSTSLRHERLHWSGWIGIFISFFGLYLVISGRANGISLPWQSLKGDLMILAGNFCWALYTVLSRPILERVSPFKLTTITLAIGTLFYLPVAARDIRQIPLKDISSGAWLALAYSTLFAIAISFVIWYTSVKRVGNTKTGIYGNITPIVAVLFAHVFLSERIALPQFMGAFIIFAGFYLTRFAKRKEKFPQRGYGNQDNLKGRTPTNGYSSIR